jgi:hypothetical protein
MMANGAGKDLQFKIVAVYRMRRASRQAHQIFAFRAGRGIGGAKAIRHGMFLFARETNLPPALAFQFKNNYNVNGTATAPHSQAGTNWKSGTIPELAGSKVTEPNAGSGSNSCSGSRRPATAGQRK